MKEEEERRRTGIRREGDGLGGGRIGVDVESVIFEDAGHYGRKK
jgi:hypothetical protein